MDTPSDAGLTSDVVDSLVQLSFAVHDALSRVAAEHGLSVTQLRLLGILRDRTPPMTAIADHLGLDRSSVTGLVDRAEGRGLVARTTSKDDARVILVKVTPSGFRIGGQLAAMVSDQVESLIGRVPPTDRDRFVRVAQLVLNADGAIGHP